MNEKSKQQVINKLDNAVEGVETGSALDIGQC